MNRLSFDQIRSINDAAKTFHPNEPVSQMIYVARKVEQLFIELNPQFDRRAGHSTPRENLLTPNPQIRTGPDGR